MKQIALKHLRAIRWFHWINFPLLAIMIWTGMWIYWANDVYRVGWGDLTILHFFPDSIYDLTHMGFKLAQGNGLALCRDVVIHHQWNCLHHLHLCLR